MTLLLLAGAQRRAPRQIAFKELDAPLRALLQEFGPSPNSRNPDYPFWHLQREGFWVVEDADILPRRQGKDRPTRTGLLKHNAKGHVPAELWDQLLADPALVRRLAQQILDRFWPASAHAAIVKRVGLDLAGETAVAQERKPPRPRD
jgi:putative restriction endonuclease